MAKVLYKQTSIFSIKMLKDAIHKNQANNGKVLLLMEII